MDLKRLSPEPRGARSTGLGNVNRRLADDFPRNNLSRIRIQRLAVQLHGLGPQPLAYFIEEIAHGADLRQTLERYARLPADFIRAYGRRQARRAPLRNQWGQTMSGGRASRDKGNRAERSVVRFLQASGFGAERVPLSGSAGGSYLGDLTVPILGVDRTVEVKVRSRGFGQLYNWLEGRDLLVVRADRREPLVVIPLRLAAEIAIAAERGKSGAK